MLAGKHNYRSGFVICVFLCWRYLTKVDINETVIGEPDVQALMRQYEDVLQHFKRVYTVRNTINYTVTDKQPYGEKVMFSFPFVDGNAV